MVFYNRVNPIQGYLGKVKLGKNLSLMPLGIDFDGLALNGTSFIPKFQQANNFDKINLFSQFGYCFQLIVLKNENKFIRLSYSYVFNQINNQNDGRVQKFDLYYTISDNNCKHLNLLAYYHINNFIDRNNTISFYQIGLGVNYGLKW